MKKRNKKKKEIKTLEYSSHYTGDKLEEGYVDFSERGQYKVEGIKTLNFLSMPTFSRLVIMYFWMYVITSAFLIIIPYYVQRYLFGIPDTLNTTGLLFSVILFAVIIGLYLFFSTYYVIKRRARRVNVKLPKDFLITYFKGVCFGYFNEKIAENLVKELSKIYIVDNRQYGGYEIPECLPLNQFQKYFKPLRFRQMIRMPSLFIESLFFISLFTAIITGFLTLKSGGALEEVGLIEQFFLNIYTFSSIHYKIYTFIVLTVLLWTQLKIIHLYDENKVMLEKLESAKE